MPDEFDPDNLDTDRQLTEVLEEQNKELKAEVERLKKLLKEAIYRTDAPAGEDCLGWQG